MTQTDSASRKIGAQSNSGPEYGSGWRMLGSDLRAVRGPAARAVIWSTVQGLPALASGHLLALALNRGFLDHHTATGLLFLCGLGGCLLAGAAATRAMFPWLASTVEPLRDALVARLVRATVQQAAAARTEATDTVAVARLTSHVEKVRGLVGAILRSARQSAVSMIAALAGLLTLAPVAAFFVLVPLAVAAAAFVASLRSLAHRSRAIVMLDEAIAAESGRIVGAVRDIVACNAQARAVGRINEMISAQATAMTRLAWSGALRTVTVGIGGQLPLVGLLIAGPYLVRDGKLNAGQLIGAISYLTAGLLPALRSLVTVATTWGIQLGAVLQRIQVGVATARILPQGGEVYQRRPSGYAIYVRELGFCYGTAAEPVIEDLHIDIPEGDHLAIVGPSGAGKSTLTHLLTGALLPDRGEVMLGDVPVAELPRRWLHQAVALIPQEAYIFAGTLRENLTYLRSRADDRQLAEAAEATGLTALIERLGGLGAEIGAGGAALSSGEAQLVAITRVFLSDAKVVILDEATCHLDPEAEAKAEGALIARPGTLIVVAHRISSAERAKRILLLDGTRAVLGTPGELPERSPLYAELLGYWQSGSLRVQPGRDRADDQRGGRLPRSYRVR